MDVITINGASLVRFVTTTHGWAERARNNICVPDKWPFMIVELFVANNGAVLMSSALGIPKSSVSSFKRQGLYYYPFDEIPTVLVDAITGHFISSYRILLTNADALLPASARPRLKLIIDNPVKAPVQAR